MTEPECEDRIRKSRGVFAQTWFLLEAADRAEALAEGSRAEADCAEDAALAYVVLADRLRLLASSLPDGGSAGDEPSSFEGLDGPAL
jgi:hypothetical protein